MSAEATDSFQEGSKPSSVFAVWSPCIHFQRIKSSFFNFQLSWKHYSLANSHQESHSKGDSEQFSSWHLPWDTEKTTV